MINFNMFMFLDGFAIQVSALSSAILVTLSRPIVGSVVLITTVLCFAIQWPITSNTAQCIRPPYWRHIRDEITSFNEMETSD